MGAIPPDRGDAAPWGGGGLAVIPLEPDGRPAGAPRRLWPPARGAPSPRARSEGDPDCPAPSDLERLSPHGLATAPAPDGVTRVGVVRHGEREAVELLHLTGRGSQASLRWVGCITLPPDSVGNDLVFTPGGGIVVTNFLSSIGGPRSVLTMLGAGLGRETGDVLTWSPESGWQTVADSRASVPNGILLSPDGRRVYVAESSAQRLRLLSLDGEEPPRVVAEVDGYPDNLSWSPRETILAVLLRDESGGYPWCLTLNLPWCRSPWSLVEIDPASGRTREILHHDGRTLHGATSVADSGEWLFFGSMAQDRVGVVFRPVGGGPPRVGQNP